MDSRRQRWRERISAFLWLLAVSAGLCFIIAAGLLTWNLIDVVPDTTEPSGDTSQPPSSGSGTRVEAVRTALTAMVGAGGLVTLFVVVRRQWAQERSDGVNRHDATERRITELYAQAVDQLGSERAAVRLGGLIALDRLGRNHPAHRQDVVDMYCAYLRMPYTPSPSDGNLGQQIQRTATPWYEHGEDAVPASEYEVRATAQRLLKSHLVAPEVPIGNKIPKATHQFWTPDLRQIDLTGAALVEFSLTNCWVPATSLRKAQLHGPFVAWHTRFTGPVRWRNAEFHGPVSLTGVFFADSVHFTNARFHHMMMCLATHFVDEADFSGAWFGRYPMFAPTFYKEARFDGTHFVEGINFEGVEFNAEASFTKAHFADSTSFEGIELGENAELTLYNATAVIDPKNSPHVWPPEWELRIDAGSPGTGRLANSEEDSTDSVPTPDSPAVP